MPPIQWPNHWDPEKSVSFGVCDSLSVKGSLASVKLGQYLVAGALPNVPHFRLRLASCDGGACDVACGYCIDARETFRSMSDWCGLRPSCGLLSEMTSASCAEFEVTLTVAEPTADAKEVTVRISGRITPPTSPIAMSPCPLWERTATLLSGQQLWPCVYVWLGDSVVRIQFL